MNILKFHFQLSTCLGFHGNTMLRQVLCMYIPKINIAALTFEDVRRVVQGLEWRRLGGLLWVSDSALDEISKEHTTDDEREAAVIHHWMLHDPLASWRRLLHCLYMSDESDRADSITHYAEELTGSYDHTIEGVSGKRG